MNGNVSMAHPQTVLPPNCAQFSQCQKQPPSKYYLNCVKYVNHHLMDYLCSVEIFSIVSQYIS